MLQAFAFLVASKNRIVDDLHEMQLTPANRQLIEGHHSASNQILVDRFAIFITSVAILTLEMVDSHSNFHVH